MWCAVNSSTTSELHVQLIRLFCHLIIEAHHDQQKPETDLYLVSQNLKTPSKN
jgi:hypothetical protein